MVDTNTTDRTAGDVHTVVVGGQKQPTEEDNAKHRAAGPIYSLEQKYQQALMIAKGAEEGLKRQRKEIDDLLARITSLEEKTKNLHPHKTE